MDSLCHKTAIRSHHKTSHLCVNSHIAHSCRYQNLIVHLMYTGADNWYIVWCLIRLISHANSTWKIYKSNIAAGLIFKLNNQLKKLLCKLWIILVGYCIACQECMHAKVFSAFWLKNFECLKKLFLCHSILGVSRIVHDTVWQCEHSTRIISAAYCLRNMSDCFLQKINMCEIIEIDDSTKLVCICKFLCRCIIWWKHDMLSVEAAWLCKHKLCVWWAVTAHVIIL